MPQITAVPVKLTTYRNQEASGTVRVEEWDRSERMKRALKAFAICWGGAIAFLPIPPIHWVMVPGLILAGPIVAAFTFGKEKQIQGGVGTCPNCAKPFTVPKGPVSWPIQTICDHCKEAVQVQSLALPDAQASAPARA